MKKILSTLALILLAVGAQAQTAFPLFQPSNGIMKGDVNTFVTTSAVGSDVTSLFSGTCNAAAFLRGDASCFDLLGGANSWTGLNTWTQNMSQSKADPRFCQYDSGSDATWFWRMSTDVLRLQVVDSTVCTTTGSAIPITIAVAGGTTSALTLAATSIAANASGTNTTFGASGITAISGVTELSGQFLNTNVNPSYYLNETDAAADNQLWRMNPAGGVLTFSARNDANNTGVNWLTVGRTGTAIGPIGFPASTGLTIASPAGGVQGNGTLNATGLFVNGTAVSTSVGANPSASLGLAAVNGAAATFMRSDAAPALSQGIAPTWTAQHIFSNTSGGGAALLSSTTPLYGWQETDAAADNQRWRIGPTSETWRLEAVNDAVGAANTAILVDRTGITIDSVGVTATAFTFNGNPVSTAAGANPTASLGLAAVNGAATTFMRSDGAPALSQAIAPTWTNTHIFANNGANATFTGADPRWNFTETDGGVDAKNWITRSVASGYDISTATDAAPFSAVNSAFNITRTGTAIGVITLNGTTVQQGANLIPNVTSTPTWTNTHTFNNTPVVPNDSWTYAKIQNVSATSRFLGRITAGAGDIEELTGTQSTTLLDVFTSGLKGLAPASGGGTTNFLRADGTWTAVPGGATGANPTASVGLAAVNGAASTFLRSDGAPALDQAIAPTWTGAHVFSNAASIKATGTVGTEVENAAPIQVVDETDAAANERSWIQKSVAGDMSFSTATDAAPNTPVNNAITITRTGTTVDTVNLQATTVQINGNPALGVSPAAGTSVGQIVSQQYKGGNTDRSSTTTLAADPTLTGLSVPVAGSYLIEGQICFTAPVAGSGGIKMRYEYSGSITTGLGIYTGNVNGATVSGGGFLALDANQISFATISTTGNCLQFNHTFSTAGSGTIDLQWAQNSSDANVTRMSAGSSVVIIRLS